MPKNSKTTPSYQDLSRQLDEIIAKLQNPDVGIDEAVQLFEAALETIQQQENLLNKAETRILALKAKAKFDGDS
ncbi:MAG TPA: exodeoxyribonuclease VII small subunit [Candidatus Saccharimonadales bacterium]|jgi:exodeoxyribonuclease VII small subunit